MKYLILVSHGQFAKGLKDSLAMFAEENLADVIAVGLEKGMSVADFKIKLKQTLSIIKANDSVIVLVDIVGGSPLTATCAVLEERALLNSAIILGGMNLQMVIAAFFAKSDLDGAEFITEVLTEANEAIQEFNLSCEEDEDDDI